LKPESSSRVSFMECLELLVDGRRTGGTDQPPMASNQDPPTGQENSRPGCETEAPGQGSFGLAPTTK
jgi:hypothetical protein